MKHLLLPLITALALPTAVSAESYWLMLQNYGSNEGPIPMRSMSQCKEQGALWNESDTAFTSSKRERGFHCVVGK